MWPVFHNQIGKSKNRWSFWILLCCLVLFLGIADGVLLCGLTLSWDGKFAGTHSFFIVANLIYKMKTMEIEHNTSLDFFIILSLSSEIIPTTLSPCHCKNPSGSLLTMIITTQFRENYVFGNYLNHCFFFEKKNNTHVKNTSETEPSQVWIEHRPLLSCSSWFWVCLIFPIFPDIEALLTGFERDLVWAKMTLNERKTL